LGNFKVPKRGRASLIGKKELEAFSNGRKSINLIPITFLPPFTRKEFKGMNQVIINPGIKSLP